MLNVSFANGVTTRIPYNPEHTVAHVLDQVKTHPDAAVPAPGRERAYLSAAVASAATRPVTVADGHPDATASITSPATSPPPPALAPSLTGRAFLHDPPFPPSLLAADSGRTLAQYGVRPEGVLFVTFLPVQAFVDPTRRVVTSGETVPKNATTCSELSRQYGGVSRDVIVHCDNTCGRTGTVYGGEHGCFSRDSALCRAALHSGALERDRGGYFTVRLCGVRERFSATSRNDVDAIAYEARFRAITVQRYMPGDEETLTTSPVL